MWSRRIPYYENSDAIDVGRKIVYSNLRLETPDSMPKEIRSIMQKCFAEKPSNPTLKPSNLFILDERPKFEEIIVTLKTIVSNASEYRSSPNFSSFF